MPTNFRHGWFLAVAIAAAGCNTELRNQGDALIDALDRNDYAAFEAVASTELRADTDATKFADIAATYDELGALADKSLTSTSYDSGTRSIIYALEYPTGELTMRLASRTDALDQFSLEGPAWTTATVNRRQHAVEALLAAARTGDRAGARALVHASVSDAELEGLFTGLGPFGAHTNLSVHDAEIPEFLVEFGNERLYAGVEFRGAMVTAFRFRPSPGR